MTWLVISTIVLIVGLSGFVVVTRTERFRKKIRMVTWLKGERWIRVWPNPGFRIGRFQWSKYYGRGHR